MPTVGQLKGNPENPEMDEKLNCVDSNHGSHNSTLLRR